MNLRYWFAAAAVLSILFPAPGATAEEKSRSDTVWVNTFNQQLVDIDSRTVTADFTFPPEGGQWGEILCYMTIACPESPGDCDPWDRLAHIRVVTDTDEKFEIMRFVTPYDITGATRPGTCSWVYDLSDYETLLHDEVTLQLFIDTWVGGGQGWLITCDFAFMPGITELEPYKITNLWNYDHLLYGKFDNPSENYLVPIAADIDAETVEAHVRTYITGHGFGNTDNAAEFSWKWHEVVADMDAYQEYVWRNDCRNNPCSPQGGTWSYSRNGWCPGDKAFPWIVDITPSIVPGETEILDYNLEPYENICDPDHPDCVDGVTCTECAWGSRQAPFYVMQTQLIEYRQRSASSTNRLVLAGPGPAYSNPPVVRAFPCEQGAAFEEEFTAYGADYYGVNVTCGRVNGGTHDVVITGAGPGDVYGPHVRGFEIDGTPLPGLSYFAYGTLKYGVNVACGDLDGDGFDEIITGAGPGAVFGPHVRAFNYDGGPGISPVPGVSYFAYGTLKWGTNVTSGDYDGDGYDEIVTGAGPGAVFGPHVRGWNVDGGTAAAIPAISFFAYETPRYGVMVGSGDVDADGIDEILTSPGPSPAFGAHVRGWNYDGDELVELPGYSFFAWPASEARYGARIYADANLDGIGGDELVVGGGPDPSMGSPVKVYTYDPATETVSQWFSLEAFPAGWTHGATVAAGWFE